MDIIHAKKPTGRTTCINDHGSIGRRSRNLKFYEKPISPTQKKDGSPVTLADIRAEEIIFQQLAYTGLPFLAEESAANGNIPELGDRYFIIDPLDGTKEFIKKNGEFTVNIALIDKGLPIGGIVTAPALNIGYVGSKLGAFSFPIINGVAGELTPIHVAGAGPIDVLASRSHCNELLDRLLCRMKTAKNISIGSSLKLCYIAAGKARLYPRFTHTSEWDIAAGQAVLEAAGGIILTTKCSALKYGKTKQKFLNPYFVAADNRDLALKTAKIMAEIS